LGYFIDGIVTVSDILSALGDLEQTSKKVIDVLSHCLVRWVIAWYVRLLLLAQLLVNLSLFYLFLWWTFS